MIGSDSSWEPVHVIALALDAFMVTSSNTIRNWIMKLMKAQTMVIKEEVSKSSFKDSHQL
jgi:hypothetical protein